MSTEEKMTAQNAEGTEELTEENLNEQRKIRREKLKKLQEAGRNPFVNETWDVDAYSESIKNDFDAMDGKESWLSETWAKLPL